MGKKLAYKAGIPCRVPVETTHREFERVKDKYGKLTPSNLLEENTPIDRPLHTYYDWDNNQAAHKYRINQSRELINGVIVVTVENGNIKEENRWVGVKISEEEAKEEKRRKNSRNYFPREEVLTDDDLKHKHLEYLKKMLCSFANNYKSFKDDEKVSELIELIHSLD